VQSDSANEFLWCRSAGVVKVELEEALRMPRHDLIAINKESRRGSPGLFPLVVLTALDGIKKKKIRLASTNGIMERALRGLGRRDSQKKFSDSLARSST